MKGFLKFLGAAALGLVLVVALAGLGGAPVYLRNPLSRLTWDDGEDRGGGAVYWKLFSSRYIAEIDRGAGICVWADIDSEAETIESLKTPGRILGLVLISRGAINDDDAPADPWRSAFSSRTATFTDGHVRCRVDY